MGKSIKLKNENYIDSSGVMHNRKTLYEYLNNRGIKLLFNGNVISNGTEN